MKTLSHAISRNILYEDANIAKRAAFEQQYGKLREVTLGKVLDLHYAGTIDPAIVEQKVIDTALEGAEWIPIHDKIATIVPMEKEIELYKVRGYTSFKDQKGITGTKVRNAGGYVDAIKLDCSGGQGMHRVEVAFEKFNKQNAGELAAAIQEAAQVMYDQLASAVITDLLADVNSTDGMTNTLANWGNSHYKALLQAFTQVAYVGRMHPDFALISPQEIYDLGISDYFIHSQYNAKAGEISMAQKGLFGYLMPNRLPIYYHYGCTAASMLVGTKAKSAVVGVYTPLTIENFDDVLDGKEGAVLTMQYDVKNGSNAQKTKPTKNSWATVTSA